MLLENNLCEYKDLCVYYNRQVENKKCNGYGSIIRFDPVTKKIDNIDCLKYFLELYHK